MEYFTFAVDPFACTADPLPSEDGLRLWKQFDGTRRSDEWTPPGVVHRRRIRPHDDFIGFYRNAPAVGPQAAALLREIAGEDVELLPLRARGREIHAVNALKTVDADPDGPLPLVFRRSGLELSSPFASRAFKEHVEKHALTGAAFLPPELDRYPVGRPAVESKRIDGTIIVEDVVAPADSAQIAAFEEYTGLVLPDGLRWVFMNINGGLAVDAPLGIQYFMRFGTGSANAVWTYELFALRRALIPISWFPFAHDGCGNTYLVDCASSTDRIYVYLHDQLDEPFVELPVGVADLIAAVDR